MHRAGRQGESSKKKMIKKPFNRTSHISSVGFDWNPKDRAFVFSPWYFGDLLKVKKRYHDYLQKSKWTHIL